MIKYPSRLPPRPALRPKGIAGLAPYRPYWRDYDQREDEELAKELFFGRLVVDAAGRSKREYPIKNTSRERSAREALARVVTYYAGENGPLIMSLLSCALRNVDASVRRIDFKSGNKRGRQSDPYADLQIYYHFLDLKPGRREVEAAVVATGQKFGRSRKAVFEAIRRAKKELSF